MAGHRWRRRVNSFSGQNRVQVVWGSGEGRASGGVLGGEFFDVGAQGVRVAGVL
ncbi:hypothetical protein [Kitasatospora sp. NPDC051914]|uniref:hypothetical protein n=1 Tax=Kitasatospora sp. NPDC051914 TaxID=3154945 RepID=UPI003427F2A3